MTARDVSLAIDQADFRAAMREAKMDLATAAVGAMEVTGREIVAFLRSLTNEMRPPANPGEGWRRAHPGHWADVTSQLAQNYRFEIRAAGRVVVFSAAGEAVVVSGTGVVPADTDPFVLEFINGTEYAAALESKAGYYVLSGVEDHVLRSLGSLALAFGFTVESPGAEPDPDPSP